MPSNSLAVLILLCAATISHAQTPTRSIDVDVCIYTATPSGIVAAIAAKREGHSVVIVEPSRWVGGMLGAGLKPLQDCPNYAATGGLTRQLLPALSRIEDTPNQSTSAPIVPRTIRENFAKLLKQHEIEVVFDHRVATCEKSEALIESVTFELAPFDELGCPIPEATRTNSLFVAARVFIDASYEGDLMARAGVSYRVGREAAAEFNEANEGVQPPMEITPIDPFVKPGRPDSGLLKWVEHDHGKPVGSADEYTQAYNYRYYTTSDPEHRIEFTPPSNYNPQDFELVGRYIQHLTNTISEQDKLHRELVGIFPGWKNSGEWNYQRKTLFSMSPLGISQLYADGDHATKAHVWKQHQDYLSGLHRFMSTDSRVPEWYRNEVAELGLDVRPHPETHGWPHQLYIRVARRLRGRYTITAHDVYNETQVDDAIGLAQYGIDTYPSRRIWFREKEHPVVAIEGKMFIGGSSGPTNVPYPIPYRAITPSEKECTNLLVPVCFSATHLGYASARMEPVFMICGESAGVAASHAISENTSVQQINMATYRQALADAGQKVHWDPEHDRSTASGSSGQALTYDRLIRECDTDNNQLVSQAEWNEAKADFVWLFEKIDTNADGNIDSAEYAAFQEYKLKHPDWAKQLRSASPSK